MQRRWKVVGTVISVNQFSVHGAVSDSCEEHKVCHARGDTDKQHFLLVDLVDKEHKDLEIVDLEARLAQYMLKSWKIHHNTMFWNDINTRIEVRLKFFTKHSQQVVGGKLEKSCTRRKMRHLSFLQRVLWIMIGWKIGVPKVDIQQEKMFDTRKVSNQAN